MKIFINSVVQENRNGFYKRLEKVTDGMEKLANRMITFDDRINDLSDAQSRLPVVI